MTPDRDLQRLLDTWFADGPMQVSDRVFDEAVSRIDRERQRPAWRFLWTGPATTARSRVAFGAAAVTVMLVAVIAGIAGIAFLGAPGGRVGGIAPPTPSPTPMPSPVPSAGPLGAGTYRVSRGPTAAVGYEFTVPDDWIAENGGQTISKHPDEPGELFLEPFVVDDVFADPCGRDDRVSVGPTADDLARALLDQPGPEASGPRDTSLGGIAGALVELAYPDGLDPEACDPPIGLQVWRTEPGGYLVLVPDGTVRVYLADVGDRRFVIVAGFRSQSTPADVAELTAIVESIRFATE